MLRLRHWPPLMVAFLVCLAVLGCGSSGGAPGSNGSAEANGAPVAGASNGGGGGPAAPGAPIKIPDIEQAQGASVDEVMSSLKNGTPLPGENNGYTGIIAQCGGQLCVTIKAKPGSGITDAFTSAYANQADECTSIGLTDPPGGSVVYPGATIWILTGRRLPCRSPSGSSPSPSGSSPSPAGSSPSPSGSSPSPSGSSPS